MDNVQPMAAADEAGQLSAGQRSAIRRAVREAVAAHGPEWAIRHTCDDLERKYGISYAAVRSLVDEELPATLPEEQLSSGQRYRLRHEYGAAISMPEGLGKEGAIAAVFEKFENQFGLSEAALRAVCAPCDSVRPIKLPGGPPVPVAVPSLPDPGQVVEVRGSTWAVTNVQAQGLPRSPADEAAAQINHVVDLQSLDEDRLGQQLSVVWELEVGHTVTPAQGLPE